MKIPETGNVGAYYGNEENGQWQPNGVIIDNGVGGGIVGSGDAGVLRPPAPVYPVHMPRGGPMSGYMMSGGYYGAAGPGYPPDNFEDYMWMENEEEFDKQVMQQLEEEALMEQCIEAMLEDEQRERRAARDNGAATSNSSTPAALQEAVSRSTLNPEAAEFVPGRARPPTEQRSDPPESKDQPLENTKTMDVEGTDVQISEEKESTPKVEPPEVSAADVQPIDDDKKSKEKPKSKSEKKKPEVKPKAKVESKVKKDLKLKTIQSEVKAAPSESVKSEINSVHNEKSEEDKEESIEVIKPSQPPSEEPPSGFKPINYAAAAKANKPKKATTPPASLPEVKTTPPKSEKPKDKTTHPPKTAAPKVKAEKPAVKVDKPVQRKNSAK